MAFTLSMVQVQSKKSHETKKTNRGKKFTIDQEKLGKLVLTDRFQAPIGTFEAGPRASEYNFKHKNNVEWTISIGKDYSWSLKHKDESVAVVENPDRNFVIKLKRGTKYGEGDVWVDFDETNSSFKLERESGFVFAVYRSDEGEVGVCGGKVEIARGERRNFVLVLACLVVFIKQKGIRKSQRQSMPVNSTLGTQAMDLATKAKRPRSNSVDGDGKGATDTTLTKKPSKLPAKDDTEKIDDKLENSKTTEKKEENQEPVDKKAEKKASSRDVNKTGKSSKTSPKKGHGKGKQSKYDKKPKKRRHSSSESGSSYSHSGSTSESSYTSESESSDKKRKGKGKGKSPRKPKAKSPKKEKSDTPRSKGKEEKGTDKAEPASEAPVGGVKAKLVQVAENLEKTNTPADGPIIPEVPSSGVSSNGSGGSVTTTVTTSSAPTVTVPSVAPHLQLQPQLPPQPQPTPTLVAHVVPTAVIVALSDNQYLLNINGLDRSKKSNISIQLKVDGVAVAGSPWEYTV